MEVAAAMVERWRRWVREDKECWGAPDICRSVTCSRSLKAKLTIPNSAPLKTMRIKAWYTQERKPKLSP